MLVTTKEAHRHATHPPPLLLHCPYLSEHHTAQQWFKPRTSAVILLPLRLTPTMKSIFCSSYLLVLSVCTTLHFHATTSGLDFPRALDRLLLVPFLSW